MKAYIYCFKKADDELGAKVPVKIPEEELIRLFNVSRENLLTSENIIKKKHKEYIFVRCGLELDLNTYDCFLSYRQE